MAIPCQVPERFRHLGERTHFPFQLADMFQRDPLHLRARAAAVLPERQKLRHLLDREAEVAGPSDEFQRMDIRLRVDAVASLGPGRGVMRPIDS